MNWENMASKLIGYVSNFKLIQRIIAYTLPHRCSLSIIAISLLTVSLSLILLGQAFKGFVNTGITDLASINKSIVLILILIALFGIGSFIRSFYVNFLAEQVVYRVRNDLVSRLLSMKIAFYDREKVSEIMVNISHNSELIGTIVINIISFLVRNIILALGAFIMMFVQSVILTFIAIFMLIIVILPIIFFSKSLKKLSKESTSYFGKICSNTEEILSNIKVVYGFNRTSYVLDKFYEENKLYLELNRKRLYSRSLFFAVTITSILLIITCVIWIGSYNIANQNMETGAFAAFLFYAMTVAFSLGGIFEVVSEFQKYLAAASHVFEIIDSQEIEDNSHHLSCIPDTKITIQFQHIEFHYPAQASKIVLNGISFTAHPREIIGIVGKSGFGKTTIINLILKFYSPQNGDILINGTSMNNIDTTSLREITAYIPQEPNILSSTIYENILIGMPGSTREQVEKAAELACVTSFSKQLTDHLQTYVGARGAGMSGGQKQRISIARIFLKKPKIIILDEATSGIDSPTELTILGNLRTELPDSIVFITGHRSSLIEKSDNILVINEGRVVDSGTHTELKTKSYIYQSLLKEERR